MRRRTVLATVLFLLLSSTTWSQQLSTRITNQDVIDMVGLGLSDDVIIAKIRAAGAGGTLQFDTSVKGLKELKAAKVSDELIKVMINPAPPCRSRRHSGRAHVRTTQTSRPQRSASTGRMAPPSPASKDKSSVRPRWAAKPAACSPTALRNRHWDAYLDGPQSKNVVSDHLPVFYIYVPDGASAADFTLIKPREKKGNRQEFQIGSFGGITGGKSGVKRDKEIAFTAEHAGIRTYKLKLAART